jgi:thiosulfate/3-mercaptopyruvate sulfurtransferase
MEMMIGRRKLCSMKTLLSTALVALFIAGIAYSLFNAARPISGQAAETRSMSALVPRSPGASDPWTAAQTVQPAELAKEIADPQVAKRPTVVCVAPHVLYMGGHIPGALYHGPGMNSKGINDLKKWAQSMPRSTNIVVYCGCCPLSRCPNLRPAFEALHEMGFTHLRALLLPTNFYTDWVKPGYPVEKGK